MQSFADMHLHAPQFPNVGTGMDLPLLDWLKAYTFPVEAKFADLSYARRVYRRLARDLIANGTTRVCMFSSLHTDATLVLMDELERAGVTGFVGPGSEPIPLTDEEYERMTSCQGTIRIDLEPGDNVRIKTGSVENAIGTVEEINAEEHKVKVSIEILNRKTTVEYDIAEVERL